jgi:hypothetical protein
MNAMSKFIHYDLGEIDSGKVVEVSLDCVANVRLMDGLNFAKYQAGQKYEYRGGMATSSPYLSQIPATGHWHLVVDMKELKGSVKASARVLPGPTGGG